MGDLYDEHYNDDDTPDEYPYYSNTTGDYSRNSLQENLPFYLTFGTFCLFIIIFHLYKHYTTENTHPLRDRLCNRIDIKKTEIIYQDGSPRLCSICLEEYKQNDKLLQLQCNHIYHPPCINDWLERQYSCPICRSEII